MENIGRGGGDSHPRRGWGGGQGSVGRGSAAGGGQNIFLSGPNFPPRNVIMAEASFSAYLFWLLKDQNSQNSIF